MRAHNLKFLFSSITALSIVLGCSVDKYSVELRHATRLGNKFAPIEIVVFSDFQCAFCKRAAAELKRIHHGRPHRVKIFFKHFPLKRHAHALKAAGAAEAAGLQGKFWEMHDLLFAHSHNLQDSTYELLAAKLDLDMERFKSDMESSGTKTRIAADKAEGEALGIKGTPFFLINRTPFRGSYRDLYERIDGLARRH